VAFFHPYTYEDFIRKGATSFIVVRQRGAGTGLTAFLDALRDRLAPVIGR
jgi:hypothetical protein